MLTFYSDLRFLRLDKWKVEEFVGHRVKERWPQYLHHACLVELEAYMKGEPVTPKLLHNVFWFLSDNMLYTSDRRQQVERLERTVGPYETVTLMATDGVCKTKYRAETLSRHFLYFRHFIEEHPGEPVPVAVRKAQALSVLDGFLWESVGPLANVLYTLQLFTPVDDRYYFLFSSEGMDNERLVKLVEELPPSVREEQLRLYERRARGDVLTVLPNEPVAQFLATFTSTNGASWRHHMATEEGVKLAPSSVSWLFVNACSLENFEVASTLFKQGFDDPCDHLCEEDRDVVISALVDYLGSGVVGEDKLKVCTMLELRCSSLGNMTEHFYPPFQTPIHLDQVKEYGERLFHVLTWNGFLTLTEASELTSK